MGGTTFHVAMYPWFAMGHITPFLQISNRLAERGHRVSFLLPTNTQPRLKNLNLYPDLIQFIPVTVPHVDGLPPGTETTGDVPFSLYPLLMEALDHTEKDIELVLRDLKPDIVFYDFAHWIPALTRRLGIKSLHYCVISSATIAYLLSPARKLTEVQLCEADLMQPPPGFPTSAIKLHAHEARGLTAITIMECGNTVPFHERQMMALSQSDALGYRMFYEIDGQYSDYLGSQLGKPVLLSGQVVPELPTSVLEEKWAKWLGGFQADSVLYCAFGSEGILKKDQFQELLLGLELTGLPFIVATKPPSGAKTIEEALPEGFKERIQGRGVVHGGWVQQQLILGHPSVGCFVTNCGYGSLLEGLVSKCQLVLLALLGDQFIHGRMMSSDLKVGVEVEKGEEDGLFTKESVCMAVKSAMEEDSEVGREIGSRRKARIKLVSEPGYMVDNRTVEMGEDLTGVLAEILQKLTALESKQTSTEGKCGEGVESSQSWSAGTIQSRTLKLNFPTFEDGDPFGWIYQAEQFFAYHRTNQEERLIIASFHLKGEALQWFRWYEKSQVYVSWRDFVAALNDRFRPTKYDDHAGALAKLRQYSTLREYQAEFEKLANRTEGLSEMFLTRCFICGLKDDIRLDVQMFRPTSLTSTIGLDRLQEEKVATQCRLIQSDIPRPAEINPVFPTIKHLSPAEVQESRKRGLCYHCDEVPSKSQM
ncbi:hypothetical protein HHK36_003542 [Tetracentron sinense]|uniref:Retrotransposon gag domain-containing protein n=1 Tax=Tetracentron sinense TaxID=13715 RepID=A0A835DP22_TETSI|nr:hypothetical protein HHK36_003542 [Tetracentron sinense]